MSTAETGYVFSWADGNLPPLSDTLNSLRGIGWLPEEQSWWFAWNELQILLPQRLGDLAALPTDWDELRVFSAQAELRQVRQGRGWQRLLLTETRQLPPGISGWQPFGTHYRVEPSLHILWGRRLRVAGGEKRGEVLFPRPLEYDVAGETAPYDQALVADVFLYYDAEARLQAARYVRLRHLPACADVARVRPLPCFLSGGSYDTTD